MKKIVFQMQLFLLVMLFTIPVRSNTDSRLGNNSYDSLSVSDDTCIANFFYNSLGDGRYIFYDSLSFYGDDATVIWTIGDSVYSNVHYIMHDFPEQLTVASVCLTITTAGSNTCISCQSFNILQDTIQYCNANFEYAVSDTAFEGFTRIQFTNSSISNDPVISSEWSFGDGGYSNEMNPAHDYYTSIDTMIMVGLSITTSSGCRDTFFRDVFIPLHSDTSGYPCNADFTYEIIPNDSAGAAFTIVNFYNASTGVWLNYHWSFGDNTYSEEYSPAHTYYYTAETSVIVKLAVNSPMGCTDTMAREITLTISPQLFSLSGVVTGRNELLPQGTLVLYKKADNGYFEIEDANIINNGYFAFEGLQEGKYLLYAMPHMYFTGKYLPTFYVNKLQWFHADVIDLKSNTGGVTLELVPTRHVGFGNGHISGTINCKEGPFKSSKSMKSTETETPILVYLYTESGEVIGMCAPDEFNNFAFDDLLYGTYSLIIESVNLPENKTTVTLTPEVPDVGEIVFDINGFTVGTSFSNEETNFKVYSVSEEEIGIQINQGGTYQVSVINISGMSVFETTEHLSASFVNIISIGRIPQGVYLIRVQNDTKVLSQKIRK